MHLSGGLDIHVIPYAYSEQGDSGSRWPIYLKGKKENNINH